MNDLMIFAPLLIGTAILIFVLKREIPKGAAMSRPLCGVTFVISALLLWVSSAALLVYELKFYFMLNLLTVVLFFIGTAIFFKQPSGATRLNQHTLIANIWIWLGFALGLAHSLALSFTSSWPSRLIEFYSSLGLHAPPPTP